METSLGLTQVNLLLQEMPTKILCPFLTIKKLETKKCLQEKQAALTRRSLAELSACLRLKQSEELFFQHHNTTSLLLPSLLPLRRLRWSACVRARARASHRSCTSRCRHFSTNPKKSLQATPPPPLLSFLLSLQRVAPNFIYRQAASRHDECARGRLAPNSRHVPVRNSLRTCKAPRNHK